MAFLKKKDRSGLFFGLSSENYEPILYYTLSLMWSLYFGPNVAKENVGVSAP